MNIKIGAPTEYGYSLPYIRYKMSRKYDFAGKILLDYGCGNGANTVYFSKKFKKIYGIDIEMTRINDAKNYSIKNNIKNINYRIYDGYTIPFTDQYFDSVITFEVIEHTSDDRKSLSEINRVLKKGSKLILSVPNKYYLMETHGFNLPLNNIIPYNRIPFLNLLPHSFYERYGNARIYRYSEILKLLKSTGFELVDYSYIKPPFDKVKIKIFKIILQNLYQLLPDFMGGSIYIICKKI